AALAELCRLAESGSEPYKVQIIFNGLVGVPLFMQRCADTFRSSAFDQNATKAKITYDG
ncbi:11857_t:CDS:2, partial [Racocetra persica]